MRVVEAPAAAGAALSRRPSCSAITCTDRRTSGRTSAASSAVGARDQHHLVFAAEARHHLHHARIRARGTAARASPAARPSASAASEASGSSGAVALRRAGARRRDRAPSRPPPAAAMARVACAASSSAAQADLVGIGERGLLAGDRAHAHALLDVEAARLDDALLQAPALGARVLEVQVGVVEPVRRERAEHRRRACALSRS